MHSALKGLEAARAAHAAGDYPCAVEHAESALACATADDYATRALAALMVAKACWNQDKVAKAADMVDMAVTECGDDQSLQPVLAEALALQGACHARLLNPVKAVPPLRQAVALLHPGMALEARRAVYVGVGLGYQCLGLAGKAVDAYRRALDLVRQENLPEMQLRAAMNLCYAVEEAVWHLQRTNDPRAEPLLSETLALKPWMEYVADRLGTTHALGECQDAIARLLLLAGRGREARAAIEHLLAAKPDAPGDLLCDWHLALAILDREAEDEVGMTRHVAAARLAAGPAYQSPVTPGDLRRAAELLALEGKVIPSLDMAWKYHARVLANETAALEAKLEEVSTTLAHQTLQLQVAELRERNDGLAERERELVQLSRLDPLTGTWNRRGLLVEFTRHMASGLSFYLMLLDLDHFKHINDQHGHAVGDQVLKGVIKILAARLRDVDCVGRLGGEEFVVLFGGTDQRGALKVAMKLQEYVRDREWSRTAVGLTVNFSAGLVEVRPDEPFQEAVDRADALMYLAKANGRGRIETEIQA